MGRQRLIVLFLLFFASLMLACEKENNNGAGASAQDLEKANNLLSSVRQNFEECGTYGKSYAICVDETLDYLGTQPDLIDYKIGQDGTTILFTHESGIDGAFLTDAKDDEGLVHVPLQFESFSAPLAFQGYAVIYEAPDFSDFDMKVKYMLEKAGYNVVLYLNDAFTIVSLNEFTENQINVISAHGYLNKQDEECFVTGQRLVDGGGGSWGGENIGNGVALATYDGAEGNYYSVCPSYFLSFSSSSSSMMLVNACHSLQNNILAEILTDRGLNLYLGWTESVKVGCADPAAELFMKELLNTKTAADVFAQSGGFFECNYYDNKRKQNIEVKLEYYPESAGDFKLSSIQNSVCAPNCEGKECGNDGCGGSCGECYNDTTCAEWGICVLNYSCMEILNCMENLDCTGTDCYTYMCYDNGTESAQIKFDAYIECRDQYCYDPANYAQCGKDMCPNEYWDCVNDN